MWNRMVGLFVILSVVAVGCGTTGAKISTEVFPLTVDHRESFKKMFSAGKYAIGLENPQIIEAGFPCCDVEGVTESGAVILLFNEEVNTDEVLRYMKENNLRPGNARELLAFATRYPKETERMRVLAAFGSVWVDYFSGRLIVGSMDMDDKLYLEFLWYDRKWEAYSHFLAFRK